jgi:hypothetical protein
MLDSPPAFSNKLDNSWRTESVSRIPQKESNSLDNETRRSIIAASSIENSEQQLGSFYWVTITAQQLPQTVQ